MREYMLVNDTHKLVYVEVVLKELPSSPWGDGEHTIGEFFKGEDGEWHSDFENKMQLYAIAFILNMTTDAILDRLQARELITFKVGDIK